MKPPEFIYHPEIDGLVEIQLDYFRDHRGRNIELYDEETYSVCPEFKGLTFKTISSSISTLGVLRGGHADANSKKLISIIDGGVQFVVADMRPESKTYLNHKEFFVNYLNHRQFLVPEMCPNFHLCLTSEVKFHYLLSAGYAPPEQQIHLHWQDPRFDFKWRIQNPILSDRDK